MVARAAMVITRAVQRTVWPRGSGMVVEAVQVGQQRRSRPKCISGNSLRVIFLGFRALRHLHAGPHPGRKSQLLSPRRERDV